MGYSWAESPGWFDVLPNKPAPDVMHERVHCCDEAANHQLPIAVAFWIIQIVPAGECSNLTQNLMQIHCSTNSVILNWQPHSAHARSRESTTPPNQTINKEYYLHVLHRLRDAIRWKRPQLWATGGWQLHNVPAQVSSLMQFFGETSNHPGDSAPLQPRFGALRLLAFPKTKSTFEREEISDHQWDSGKYNGAADCDCENCVRSQGSY